MPIPESPSPEQLRILLARAKRENLDATILERLTVILHFAEHPYSISETCRQFGISRSTFHRWVDRFDPENLSSLADKSHEPLSCRHSTIDLQSLELIRGYRIRYPLMGKERIAELLLQDHATEISSSSVGRVIERECLYFADTPFHWKKRLEKQRAEGRTVESVEERSLEGCSDIASEIDPSLEGCAQNNAVIDHHLEVESVFSTVSEYSRASLRSLKDPTRTSCVQEISSHVTVEPEAEVDARDDEQLAFVRPFSWRSVKHVIVVSSVITNIAFVSLLLGSAFLEHVSTPAPFEVQAATLHAAPAAHYIP